MAFGSNLSQQDDFQRSAMIKQDVKNNMDEPAVEILNSKDDKVWRGTIKAWTEEQIIKLNKAVALFGNNWELISKYVGRSKDACGKKLKYVSRNNETEWTDVEIELLK